MGGLGKPNSQLTDGGHPAGKNSQKQMIVDR